MQPLIPPPLSDTGALPWPRTLQKWLDVNPISALTRTQGYFILPSFFVNINWLGYSDIVAAFNFEGTSAFSLSGLSQIPVNPNYLLCISWVDGNNDIFRYAIWQNVGEIVMFDIPLYTGQVIQKNFRLEVWSTSNSPNETVFQNTPVQFYTGVLGKQDYRFAQDFSIATADPIVTNFSINSNSSVGLQPQVTNTTASTFYNWFRADTLENPTDNWSPTLGSNYITGDLISGTGLQSSTDPLINNQDVLSNYLNSINGTTNANNPNDIWFSFQYQGDGALMTILNGVTKISELVVQNGGLYVDGSQVVGDGTLVMGNYYFIEWSYIVGLSDGPTYIGLSSITGPSISQQQFRANVGNVRTGGDTFIINNDNTANPFITDLIIYNNTSTDLDTAVILTNIAYFLGRYQSVYALPFVFPVGSYPQPNVPFFTTLNQNNTKVPPGQIVFASSGGGVQGAG